MKFRRSSVYIVLLVTTILAGLGFRGKAELLLASADLDRSKAADNSNLPQFKSSLDPLQTNRATFSTRVADVTSPFNVISRSVLAGDRVPVEIVNAANPLAAYELVGEGTIEKVGERSWIWRAPGARGVSPVTITELQSGEKATINFLVMAPYSTMRARRINGYAIGEYPARPLSGNPIYTRPRGFVEVTPENENSPVSPHFRLKQFLCKQESGYPKYLVLNERLILKLELILEEVNRRGYDIDTFHVMSGYRTPAYNAGLKNVKFSMHQFGYAADIFVDQQPCDGVMDDLNRDGRINHRDAAVLSSIIDRMDQDAEFQEFQGGLGRYEKTKSHGPFVHVDVRGWDARWGLGARPPAERRGLRPASMRTRASMTQSR